MKRSLALSTVFAASFALSMSVAVQPAAAQRSVQPPAVISAVSGADLFRFYCATCHGVDGKGDGPVVPSLRQPPPDLTKIAARHRGHFPSEELRRFVAGTDQPAPAHGSREMPVWGPIFRSLEPHDRLTQVRIENLVAYIETLQKPQ